MFSKAIKKCGPVALIVAMLFSGGIVSAMPVLQDGEPEGVVPPTHGQATSGTEGQTRAAETLPTALMDPDKIGWVSLRDASSSQFSDFFQSQKDTQMMIDIEVDEVNGQQQVAGVWQQNTDGRGWAEKRNLTSAQFSENWNNYKDQGYRLIDQEAYLLNGNRYYAGVWVENKEGLGWASWRNLTSAQFSDKFAQYKNTHMIIDVEAYLTKDNEMRYAMVWVQNSESLGWKEHRNMTSAQFSERFNQYKADYRMIDVEGYKNSNGDMRYAGIWVENENGRGWAELRGMTANRFRNEWYRRRDLGYRLIDFEKYETNSGYRYAGIWRQNGDITDWSLKGDVNARVQQEVNDFDVPGISVAIIKDGQFVYHRGFGDADIDEDIWFSSRTIARLASISKAVGGVLGVRLHQEGELNIDALARAYEPSLPDHHVQTLRQLLSNRGGIGHYPDHGSANAQFDTALAGAQFFINDPLVYPLGESCKYSTHGYTVFGLGVEGAVNDPIAEVIEETLSQPFGLPSFQAEDRSDGNWQRAKLYNGSKQETAADNISWKVLGGGMESNVYDLARFGNKVLNGSILNQASRDMLWGIPAPVNCSNYALGWDTGTDQGTMVVAKAGAQLGAQSYIRMYPEHDIVIAILTNQRDDHNPVQLGRDIGTLMLDNLPPAAQSQGLPFMNFYHLAVGDAQIVKDSDGFLNVNGFGFSGQDGFKVSVEDASKWKADLGIDFISAVKADGELAVHAMTGTGRGKSELSALRLVETKGGMAVEPSFASDGYEIELYGPTGKIKTIIVPPDQPIPATLFDWSQIFCEIESPHPLGIASQICRITIEYGHNQDGGGEWSIVFGGEVSAQTGDGSKPVKVTEIKLKAPKKLQIGRTIAADETLSGIEIYGTNLDRVVIYEESAEQAPTLTQVFLPLVVR